MNFSLYIAFTFPALNVTQIRDLPEKRANTEARRLRDTEIFNAKGEGAKAQSEIMLGHGDAVSRLIRAA